MRSVVRVFSLSAALLLCLAIAPAFAGTATSSFTVTAGVSSTCTISTVGIAFGVYDPIVAHASTPRDAEGSVTITCTRGAITSIALSTGANGASASGTTRAMLAGTELLNYEIYRESGRTTMWGPAGTDVFTPPPAPSRAPRTYQTFGRIPAGQDVPTGAYTDTVTATVNF